MCSIFGYLGHKKNWHPSLFGQLKRSAGDRGRDGGNWKKYELGEDRIGVLGNWRATPTPEVQDAPLQPYSGLVHNGTIANDKELGAEPGEVDSMVLARVLVRDNVETLATSLAAVKGSYALAMTNGQTILLARNYKPIYWASIRRGRYFSSMARHFDGVLHGSAPIEMKPYSVLNLQTLYSLELPRTTAPRAAVIASAGLDSTTVAYMLKAQGYEVALIHFKYGCKAEGPESERIKAIAADLGAEYAFLDLNYAGLGLAAGALFGDKPIAGPIEGAEFAHEWVPARNLVMLSLATAWAETHAYHHIALGNNLEESGAYPDNEEEFTTLFNRLMPYAVHDGYRVDVVSPVGHLMKHEIVAEGLRLGVPYELTWSCYRGGERHCGRCGPCFMRRTAFERNGKEDPVEYDKDDTQTRV